MWMNQSSVNMLNLLSRSAFRTVAVRSFSNTAARFSDTETKTLDQIKTGLKEAMRAKDSATCTVLRSILSEHQYAEKQQGGTPATLSSLLQKAIARRHEASNQFLSAKPCRKDLAETEQNEAKILEKYLPRQMSIEEVEKIATQVFQTLKQQGKINDQNNNNKRALGLLIKGVNELVDRAVAPGALVSQACNNVLGL